MLLCCTSSRPDRVPEWASVHRWLQGRVASRRYLESCGIPDRGGRSFHIFRTCAGSAGIRARHALLHHSEYRARCAASSSCIALRCVHCIHTSRNRRKGRGSDDPYPPCLRPCDFDHLGSPCRSLLVLLSVDFCEIAGRLLFASRPPEQ